MFQIVKPSLLTCRSGDYESNAIWTGQIGVKTNILWAKWNEWQNCNIWKHILNLSKWFYAFKNQKRIFEKTLWTADWLTKSRGSLQQKDPRRGTRRFWPLDSRSTAETRWEGREGGAGGRNSWASGVAPWTAVRRSPTWPVRPLECTVFQTESTGRERESRWVRTGVNRGRRSSQHGGPRRHHGWSYRSSWGRL